jgi:4-hydroxybenzoate polyprenyltransferase
MSTTPAKGLIALLRLPYWMMTGGLALLTSFAITKGGLDLQTGLLTFFSMAFITSAGFALNDYFDKESDAIIKPKRPIPSGALSLKQVVVISVLLFALGLSLSALINQLSILILLVDSVLLVIYSAFIKRKSGFAANTLVGILTGTAFLYGEAVTLGPNVLSPLSLSLASLSLYPIACGTFCETSLVSKAIRKLVIRHFHRKLVTPMRRRLQLFSSLQLAFLCLCHIFLATSRYFICRLS